MADKENKVDPRLESLAAIFASPKPTATPESVPLIKALPTKPPLVAPEKLPEGGLVAPPAIPGNPIFGGIR